jgi:hypothetical protein
MAKQRFRRQVGGLASKGERITIGHVSSNGGAVKKRQGQGMFWQP